MLLVTDTARDRDPVAVMRIDCVKEAAVIVIGALLKGVSRLSYGMS